MHSSMCEPSHAHRYMHALKCTLIFKQTKIMLSSYAHVPSCFRLLSVIAGTFVVQVTATDADDPTYGNSAKVVYSILQGQPYFSVESETG